MEKLVLRMDALERQLKYKDEEIQKLQQEIAGLKERIKQLEEENKKLKDDAASLKKENLKLHKELRKYHNENTPSGSIPPYLKVVLERDQPEEPKEKPETKSANIRNARPKRCNRTEKLKLTSCPHCGGKLRKKKAIPRTRVVIKLIVPETEAVRYVIPGYFCKHCKKEVSPKVPDALPNSKFDLNLLLLLSYLSVGINVSHRNISGLLLEIFGLEISPASVVNNLKKLKDYLGDEYAKLEQEIRKEKVYYRDETGWRRNGKVNWVWVVATMKRIFYRIEESRGKSTANKFRPSRNGTTVCDGYSVYNDSKNIQRCWAHLLDKAKCPEYWFQSEEESQDYVELVDLLKELFHNAKEDRKRSGCSAELRRAYDEKLLKLLQTPRFEGKNLLALTNYIMGFNGQWFTFLEFPEVEPTNNRAERALRHVVLKRKISQGSRSWESQRSYAMQASLYMTSRLRGKNYMDALRDVVEPKINVVGKF
ncbi:MAG: IS66 family transposase [Candidatus Micrarchaeota archaeon]